MLVGVVKAVGEGNRTAIKAVAESLWGHLDSAQQSKVRLPDYGVMDFRGVTIPSNSM